MARDSIKVLVLVDSLLPGGAERSLLSTLPGLRQHNVTPTLVCLKRVPVNLEHDAKALGFAPHYISNDGLKAKWYLRLPVWAWRLRKLVLAVRPDLVHSTLFQSSMTCRLALIGTGIPQLTSVVNMDYSPERANDPNIKGGRFLASLKIHFLRILNCLTTSLVSHFHAVTPALKEETSRQLGVPDNKITVIFRGRNEPEFTSRAHVNRVRRELGITQNAKIVLNIGSQEYQKGQLFLLRAMASDSLRQRNLTLLVAGREGAVSEMLKEEVQELGLQEKVRFLGHRDDVQDLLAAADIFALPSLFEGAAGALLEAMSAGLPIVVTQLDELRGVIDSDCAITVPPKSPGAIAESICRLLDNDELAISLGASGAKHFQRNFRLQSVIRLMADLYHQCAAKKRQRPSSSKATQGIDSKEPQK